jgi:Ca-activated chloride channel family protein
MQRLLPGLLVVLLLVTQAPAAGLLIPKDSGSAPLDMVDHKVTVTIDEQVAVTRVEQTFRNPTARQLEATYVFPVPKGASVNKFAMWVDGKEVKGEMVEADKARSIYTDIVRRIQDPGLLEYMGNNLLRLRVFPVPANGEQKVSVSFTSVNNKDSGLVEYTYPLKTDSQASRTQEKFHIDIKIKSQRGITNVYSPTHPVTVEHKGDRAALIHFERKQELLDKDFQFYYALGKKDVGLTALMHRPEGDGKGHFLFLISPRAELSKTQELPRDMVFVLDTSGSMSGAKMQQARNALKFCLDRLGSRDRFAVLNFATTVGQFADGLSPVDKGHLARARKWVDDLEAVGGTAIEAALKAALDLRPANTSRTFTVVFFTDGEPTVGETNPDKIVKGVTERNTSNTRIFTFGVGNDVNATLLDRLADSTRAVSTYVRPEEDIEVKVSSLYAKISHPVLTDLKLAAGKGVQFSEVYPSKLPDLFHGGQVVVLGRYTGNGHKAITLSGKVGNEVREFVYEVSFPTHTKEDKGFVEGLWARRKVGYLLDEIRRNGERKELVEEVVKLAKKHGITTPYTSCLVVPDKTPSAPSAIAGIRAGSFRDESPRPQYRAVITAPMYDGVPHGMNITGIPGAAAAPPVPPSTPSGRITYAPAFTYENSTATSATGTSPNAAKPTYLATPAPCADACAFPQTEAESLRVAQQLREALARNEAHTGKLGVDFAMQLDNLRNQNQLDGMPARKAAGRTCRRIDGIWIDEHFNAKMPTVTIKAMSKAWFRMLEKQPKIKDVFQLGSRVIWVTPSGTALVIDPANGKETMSDADIDWLFVKR